MTYSYDPLKIRERGKDQMRFEIGDTIVDGGANTCVLADEEYESILSGMTEGTIAWKKTKLLILEAVLFKMSYQVDTKIDVLQYNFSNRTERWKKLYNDLKKEIGKITSLPTMDKTAMNKQPYFYTDMQSNPKIIISAPNN